MDWLPATLLMININTNFGNQGLYAPVDAKSVVNMANSAGKMDIASDASFSKNNLAFVPGQTVYVRVKVGNDGANKHTLSIRSGNNAVLATYQLEKDAAGLFSANFPAPSEPGTYSLEANITSGGSVSDFVSTITVGNPSDSVQANVKVENNVGGESSPRPTDFSVPTPTVVPTTSIKGASGLLGKIWSKISNFFEGLF